ncbi:MAG: HU family DNA-binding protein [Deltaproteobacteria bacterium]|nr:HU family DNA-binding protein [Deltaproteobacteria bacterium]
MNKVELVKKIATSAGLSQVAAEKALNGFTEAVQDAMAKGESVALIGFGTFSVSKRAARKGRNPQTGQSIDIAAKNVAKFKAGSRLSEAVN